ncbi:DUF6345 domain-containing protein [Methanoregula formicica]|uniref:NHL repeat protein n=1 Tax=Methanoregula formicica (strain DSM 22288 / NBRC 105244 / SMSP) TaxID=593750 RepID=L0H9P4_METFS|nr:DUF6345 domain-containing protein [Methanoregula formicica]AGB01472.1 hypothetical protein Metfor_0399 [Methanoregula formicica SMSP]
MEEAIIGNRICLCLVCVIIIGLPTASAGNESDIAVIETGHVNQTVSILPDAAHDSNETGFLNITSGNAGDSSVAVQTSPQENNATAPTIITSGGPENRSLMAQRLALRAGYPPARTDEPASDIHPGNSLMKAGVSASGSPDPESYVYAMQWGTSGTSTGQFNNIEGMAEDGSGNVYVADGKNSRIQKLRSDGTYLAQWGTNGSGTGQFYMISGIAVDPSGNIYAVDMGNSRVQKFGPNGTFLTHWGTQGAGNGQFYFPRSIATDTPGNVYVTESSANERVQKFSSGGSYISQWGTEGTGNGQFNYLHGVATDTSGNVYVADSSNHRVQKFSSDGKYIAQWGTRGTGNGQFNRPYGIATDTSGNVYVVDTWNSRVQKFKSDGTYVTQWGTYGNGIGEFNFPYAIAVDTRGYVYVGDDNDRVQVFKLPGVQPERFTYSMTNTISKYDQPPHFIRSDAEMQNVSLWISKDARWKLIFSKNDTDVNSEDFGTLGAGLNNATLHWHTGHGGYDPQHLDQSGLAIINTVKLEECKVNQSKDCTIGINGHSICEYKRTTCAISDYTDILTPQEIAGKWNKNNKWVVLSSCQVLQDDRWNGALGTTHGIFGFSTDSIADPSLSYQFFKYAMEDRLPLAKAWRNATIDVYNGKDVQGPVIISPDGSSFTVTRIPITATVRFANESQYNNDHLPGYGIVEPDVNPDDIVVKSWDCVKKNGE